MKANEIPQLSNATVADKLELIDDLWAGIPAENIDAIPEHLQELQRRVDAIRADPEKALSVDEARGRLRELTGY